MSCLFFFYPIELLFAASVRRIFAKLFFLLILPVYLRPNVVIFL